MATCIFAWLHIGHDNVWHPIGYESPTGCQNIDVPNVQPHTGLCETIGNLLVLQICKP